MLTVEQYTELYGALQVCLVDLHTTPEQYEAAHHLPGWYAEMLKETPTTTWVAKEDIDPGTAFDHRVATSPIAVARLLLESCPHGIIIKDYVKSRKHEWEEACFVPNVDKLEEVLRNFMERQGSDLQGGVVFREFLPLRSVGKHPDSGMPMGEEFRLFWMNGKIAGVAEYWPSEFYEGEDRTDERTGTTYRVPEALNTLPDPHSLAELALSINNPFISMDLARTEDGEWFIMEVGDGQVSGLPRGRLDAELIYSRLDRHMGPPGIPADAAPMTRAQFDGMSCHAEGCDHSSHDTEMYLHPRCHVGSPTWAVYEDGVVNVKCAECETLVVRIAVAPGTVSED